MNLLPREIDKEDRRCRRANNENRGVHDVIAKGPAEADEGASENKRNKAGGADQPVGGRLRQPRGVRGCIWSHAVLCILDDALRVDGWWRPVKHRASISCSHQQRERATSRGRALACEFAVPSSGNEKGLERGPFELTAGMRYARLRRLAARPARPRPRSASVAGSGAP